MSEEKVEEGKIEGFDYRSTIRDPKTGKTIKEQHFIRHVSQKHGEFLERNGKFYHPGSNTETIPDPRIVAEQVIVQVVEKKPEVSLTKKA